MNVDNLQELDRLIAIIEDNPTLLQRSSAPVLGIRINPQVGTGSIAALSTGGLISKFGVPLLEQREAVPWLNALHLHVGSQGVPLELAVQGAVEVWELAKEINEVCVGNRIQVFDIGGGMPVDFSTDHDHDAAELDTSMRGEETEQDPDGGVYSQHVALLRSAIPELFQPNCPTQLVTENGRVFVHDAHGRLKSAGNVPEGEAVCVETDVVGPLCFQGDMIAQARPLPITEPDNFVVVADAGAYTLSNWSCYNSRASPPVYGFSIVRGSATQEALALKTQVLRAAESIEQVVAFWD
eukprot:gene5718-19002_t